MFVYKQKFIFNTDTKFCCVRFFLCKADSKKIYHGDIFFNKYLFNEKKMPLKK